MTNYQQFIINYLILILLGCNVESSKEELRGDLKVIRSYYENGTVETEVTIDKDSIRHGLGKKYYPSGSLKFEVDFFNGRKQGQEKGYFENGSLRYISWYKDGLEDSVAIWYYMDGSIESIDNWRKGKLVGEQLKYHQNQNLKFYSYYDPTGEPVYRRIYSEDGNFISEEGSRNTNIVSVTRANNQFELGDTLQIRIYAPNPPDIKVHLKSLLLDKRKSIIHSESLSLKNGKTTFSKVLKRQGEYYFKTEYKFEDTVSKEINVYNNDFKFEVIGPN